MSQNKSIDVVKADTLDRKLVLGYQGWFGCPRDGSVASAWKHWFRTNTPIATSLTVDLWPDTTGFDQAELFQTNMTHLDGSPAVLYSAYNRATVARHFEWLRDYNLDGVMLQRFVNELSTTEGKKFRDQVATNVEAGARATGRVFCIMYDISGSNEASIVKDLQTDWDYLVNKQITKSPSYLHHKGKLLLAIYGLGFRDRPGNALQAKTIIDHFQSKAQVTLLGGVPADWRTLSGDCKTDTPEDWKSVFMSFDVLSPWFVGHSDAGTGDFTNNYIVKDLQYLPPSKYLPVVFPGFSWNNLNNGKLNQMPRNGGRFWWNQVYQAISAGCTMIYGAMFDEVDEGTAMYKCVADQKSLPLQAQDRLVHFSIDGESVPSDRYLWLAGQGSRMLRGEFQPTPTMPTQPVS